MARNICSVIVSFVKTGAVKIALQMNLCSYFPNFSIRVVCVTRDPYICVFGENRCREGCASLMGVNGITFNGKKKYDIL
jgi:hypothetical protein